MDQSAAHDLSRHPPTLADSGPHRLLLIEEEGALLFQDPALVIAEVQDGIDC